MAPPEQIDAAIRQLVSKAITTEGQVIDVLTADDLPKPDISFLSEEFLAEVRGLKHMNVAAELLEKLLKDELKVRSKRNLVQSPVFSEKLKKTIKAYHNRAIATQEVRQNDVTQILAGRSSSWLNRPQYWHCRCLAGRLINISANFKREGLPSSIPISLLEESAEHELVQRS
ncbi:type I restriction enzyme endonuclease domain-containing protein [Pirellulaceae bacterium SH449]